ncbi:MAG: hypothetical protein IPH75_09400 [bacterium]|nr:hypothetical protein [bacterium]
MHRNDRSTKVQERRRGPKAKTAGPYNDDSMDEMNNRQGKPGRRQWQQEKQLLKQLDPKLLEEYLLDNE